MATFSAPFVGYYFSRKHRPRWVARATFIMGLSSFMMAVLHFCYGPGIDALNLTLEYGAKLDSNETSVFSEEQKRKTLCQLDCKEFKYRSRIMCIYL